MLSLKRIAFVKRHYNHFLFQTVLLLVHLSPKTAAAGKPKYGLKKITAENFQSTVIDGPEPDAWIVGVKGALGSSQSETWIEFEFALRGLMVRVGIVDPQTDGAFLKRKGFLDKTNKYPLARVYPYGGWKIKANGAINVYKWFEARKVAVASVPDETTRVLDMKDLEHFVQSSYQRSPPRFPVLLFTDKRSTSALYKALALKYPTYFNFGVMRKPSKEFKQKFNIKKLPAILVMISTLLPDKQLTFSGIPYETRAYGAVSYLTVAKFLYSIHELHWKNLPMIKKFKGRMTLKEDYMAEVKSILAVPEATDEDSAEKPSKPVKEPRVIEITYGNHKELCSDKAVGVCLIAFVDGSSKEEVRQTLRVLRDVQKIESMEDKPLHYLWVNATCHPEYGEVFGILPESLPSLLLAKPRQRLFATTTDLTAESISDRVMKVLLGREELAKYSRFNDMTSTDCRQKDGWRDDRQENTFRDDEL